MVDESRVVTCPYCEKRLSYPLVRVKCPYCDKVMVFSLPEYAFYDGPVGCEHCHRKSRLRIGGYYNGNYGGTLTTSEPVWRGGRPLTPGGLLLSIEPVVPTDLVLGDSDKIPDGPRHDLESAVRCLEIGQFQATAMLCRRCVQSALKTKGIPEDAPSRMIDIARQQGTLSELANKQSDAVTFMGNKAAHPLDDPLLNSWSPTLGKGYRWLGGYSWSCLTLTSWLFLRMRRPADHGEAVESSWPVADSSRIGKALEQPHLHPC